MFADPDPLRDLLRDARPRSAIRPSKDDASRDTAGLLVKYSSLQEMPDFVDGAGIDTVQTRLPPVSIASRDL